VDIDYLAGVAFSEGYNKYAESLIEGAMGTTSFDNMGPIGLDCFGDVAVLLKSKGYLRKNYGDKKEFKFAGIKLLNENGEQFSLVKFKDATSALEALAALLAYSKNLFTTDTGYGIEGMTDEEMKAWSYLYFNTGQARGRKIFIKYGIHGLIGHFDVIGIKDARYNANRVIGTTLLFKKVGIFTSINSNVGINNISNLQENRWANMQNIETSFNTESDKLISKMQDLEQRLTGATKLKSIRSYEKQMGKLRERMIKLENARTEILAGTAQTPFYRFIANAGARGIREGL
jgi:hypothetical protein